MASVSKLASQQLVGGDAPRELVAAPVDVAACEQLEIGREGVGEARQVTVRGLDSDVFAFSDANCAWEPDALTRLVRVFADPKVAYVCGRLRLRR